MKKLFQTLLTPVIWKVINGKGISIEIQYVSWSVACFFLAIYSGGTVTNGFPETFWQWVKVLPLFLPFFFMLFLVIRAQINPSFYQLSDIPKEWKITKLNLSRQLWFKMSSEDVAEREELEDWFYNKYGMYYREMKSHWIYRMQWIILIGLSLLGFYIGK